MRAAVVLAGTVLFGVLMYRTGLDHSDQKVARLTRAGATLEKKNARLEREKSELEKALARAKAHARELSQRYEREVPKGPVKELAGLVRDKLSAGVGAERLAFVLREAHDEPACEGGPVNKRFLLQTPLYEGPNSAVSFADDTITVTGSGVSATDTNGNPEAWYDPAKPVTIAFTLLGGETVEVSGKLPLHHAMVMGDAEHRFSVVQGARGFVRVIGQRCRYP